MDPSPDQEQPKRGIDAGRGIADPALLPATNYLLLPKATRPRIIANAIMAFSIVFAFLYRRLRGKGRDRHRLGTQLQ